MATLDREAFLTLAVPAVAGELIGIGDSTARAFCRELLQAMDGLPKPRAMVYRRAFWHLLNTRAGERYGFYARHRRRRGNYGQQMDEVFRALWVYLCGAWGYDGL